MKNDAYSEGGIPLFDTIDDEGGRRVRLPIHISKALSGPLIKAFADTIADEERLPAFVRLTVHCES